MCTIASSYYGDSLVNIDWGAKDCCFITVWVWNEQDATYNLKLSIKKEEIPLYLDLGKVLKRIYKKALKGISFPLCRPREGMKVVKMYDACKKDGRIW